MRGPIKLLTDAWEVFTSNTKLFLGIYLVPAVLSFLFVILFETGSSEEEMFSSVTGGLLFVAFVISMMVVNVMMGIAMMKAVSDPAGSTVK